MYLDSALLHIEMLRCLKKFKSEIDSSAVLFFSDFAKNYKFVIQDEV